MHLASALSASLLALASTGASASPPPAARPAPAPAAGHTRETGNVAELLLAARAAHTPAPQPHVVPRAGAASSCDRKALYSYSSIVTGDRPLMPWFLTEIVQPHISSEKCSFTVPANRSSAMMSFVERANSHTDRSRYEASVLQAQCPKYTKTDYAEERGCTASDATFFWEDDQGRVTGEPWTVANKQVQTAFPITMAPLTENPCILPAHSTIIELFNAFPSLAPALRQYFVSEARASSSNRGCTMLIPASLSSDFERYLSDQRAYTEKFYSGVRILETVCPAYVSRQRESDLAYRDTSSSSACSGDIAALIFTDAAGAEQGATTFSVMHMLTMPEEGTTATGVGATQTGGNAAPTGTGAPGNGAGGRSTGLRAAAYMAMGATLVAILLAA